MAAWGRELKRRATRFLDRHPTLRLLERNIARDNVGILAGYIAWSVLTSIIPLTVSVVAIFGFFVQDPRAQADLVEELSRLFQGAVTTDQINSAVRTLTQHSGLVGVLGILGLIWGASNIGGSFASAFRVIFATRARPFLREKLLDIGMLFVFTALMAAVLFSSTAVAFLNSHASALPLPAPTQAVVLTGVSFLSAFVLFGAIYTVFPNIEAGYKLRSVWRGALLAAALFQLASTVWPIYVRLSHASRFGAVIFSLLILTAWIYAFSYILILGAEVIAVASQQEMRAMHEQAGAGADRMLATRDDLLPG